MFTANVIPTSKGKNGSMKVSLAGFTNGKFSDDQLGEITACATQLQMWVEKSEISPDTIELDDALEVYETKPGHVFTLAAAHTSKDGYMMRYGIEPGLDESEEEFFEAALPFSGEDAYPYTILDFECFVCEGQGQLDGGQKCSNCDVLGDLTVDMFWDQEWNVTAEFQQNFG